MINNNIHICFFAHSSELGGAERSLLDLMRQLVKQGIRCSTIMQGEGALKDACLKNHIEVKSVDIMPWWCDRNDVVVEFTKKIADSMEQTFTDILDFIKEQNVNVIYTQTVVSPFGAMVAEKLGLPHIWALREYGERDHYLKFIFGFQESMMQMYKTSDFVLSVSKDVSKVVLAENAKNENVVINYSSVEIPDVYSDKEFAIFKRDTVKIGVFGTVIEGKNQKDAVEACLKLLKNDYNVKLYIVGRRYNEYYKQLLALIDEPYREKLIFIDYMDDPIEIMAKMDIVLSCAISEAMGRTLFEAILLKKPVIYSNVGGAKEIYTDGMHGLGYELYDIDDLTAKIVYCIENISDTKERVKNAYEYVVNAFTVQDYIKPLLDILDGLNDYTVKRKEKYVTEFILKNTKKIFRERMLALEAESTQLKGLLNQKEQTIQNQQQELYQKEQYIKEQMEEQERSRIIIEQKEQDIIEKNSLIDTKDNQINEHIQTINSLINSKSWKLTHPLRAATLFVKKIRLPKYKNLFVINSFEHRYAKKIKDRLPMSLSYKIANIIKSKKNLDVNPMPWDFPILKASQYKEKSILIVAELSIPQCKKYRVDQKVEMFKYLGYDTSVVSWTDYHLARNKLQLSSIVIFYRVPMLDFVPDLINEANRLKIPTFYDVDDLIFDKKELKKNSNNSKLSDKVQQEIYNGAELYRLALSKCKHAISSTSVLGEYMSRHIEGKLFTVPNCLDEELLSFVSSNNKRDKDKKKIQIVYGSGTSTHDNDFLEASDAIFGILQKYANVEFIIHGILNLPKEFDRLSSQIKKIPLMSAKDYYTALNNYDINIAPLENTVFNDAKSNIKYLEASIFRLPTISSNAQEFRDVIENGQNGYIADCKDDWFKYLEKLILDKDLRESIGDNAFNSIMNDFRIDSVAKKYLKPIVDRYLYPNENNKTHVLMVNILFSPISFGGATIVVEELAKNIYQFEDYHIDIFTGFWDSGSTDIFEYDIARYESNDLSIIGTKFPSPMTRELEYKNSKMLDLFIEVLKVQKPDIVHFHSIQQLSASLVEACINLKIPYIITLHDMWWLCEKQFMIMDNGKYCAQKSISLDYCMDNCATDKKFTKERYEYLYPLLKKADLLLAPSKFQSSMYLSENIDHNKIIVNKNGILFPNDNFKKIRDNKEIIRFAYLGGNAIHKGYNWLKDIFESINYDNYELNLVDLHKKLGLTSIQELDWDIQGKLTISDGYEYGQKGLDDFFSNIDVLLFPSQWKESFGLTVREALVRDVWVISTDAGGVIEDIIDGENGNIVSMQDQEKFKNYIISILKNPLFFENYQNRYKNDIRSFKKQSLELKTYYERVLKDR